MDMLTQKIIIFKINNLFEVKKKTTVFWYFQEVVFDFLSFENSLMDEVLANLLFISS